MASFEIIGSQFAARVNYDLTQDVGLNRSVMKITGVSMRSTVDSWVTQSCRVVGSITINGSTAVKMEYTNTASTGIMMSKSYNTVGGSVSKYSVTVNHQEDGSGPISVYVNLSVYVNSNSMGVGGIKQTEALELPRIPRVSSLTAAGVALGQEMTITITRAAAGFTDTVTWSCGSQSGTIAAMTALTQLKWVPPVSLASQAPEATQVAVVLTVTSFLNGSQVGSKSIMVQCAIPESVVPTLSVTVADRMGHTNKFGSYVQNQSQARVVTQAAGAYGSSIRSITAKCGALSASGADVSFALGQSGSVPITVTVTDSRGRSASFGTSITVLPYRLPQATIREAYRCNETGQQQPDGQWLRVVFDGSVTALAGNGATYRGICSVHNGAESREVLLADYTGQQTVTGGSFLLTAGIDTAYDCRVSVQDDFHTVTAVDMLVGVAFALMDFCRDTRAVGIGMRAKNAGKLSIGMETDMEEHPIVNLADPTSETHAATKRYVDGLTRKAAHRNLLDNSDFRNPVNQRGKTSYTINAWGGYCIDRWRAGEQALTLTINDNGCTLSGEIYQTIDPKGNAKNLNGKTVTIAAKVNGSIGCRSGHIELIGGWVQFADFSIPGGSGYIYADSNNNLHVGLVTNNTVTVEWVALYEGEYTAETLPEYRCKGYGAELAECQRYYCKGRVVARKAIYQFYTANQCFPVTMRSDFPTITLTNIADYLSGDRLSATASPNGWDSNCLHTIQLNQEVNSDIITSDYVAIADL